ncbi:MAG: YidC/Oxa1 family membrane protein insertase [Chloroflexota bacterium]|nr:YidC/Oxa1 family membrane protein insertase [Chloroflexota bacterium]
MPSVPGWQIYIDALKSVLVAINGVVGNPGLAIIIFTLLVKVVTVPLTLKSVRSMREMQRIQPLIKEVNKRYKDDKPKQQAEMMRIYQQHGYNPMGSCLPMVLQIPIFLGLYTALGQLVGLPGSSGQGIEAFHQAFFWVPNLKDHDPFYIWPVLSGAIQFLSNRMAQPYGSNKNADPQQAMMNKMMGFLPLYLIVVYINFAAGAVIYWTFSALFQAVQTYFVNGFGTLPDVPGFKWLPKRPLPPPSPEIQREIDELQNRRDDSKDGKALPAGAGKAAAYRQDAVRRAAAPATNPDGTPRRKSFMEKMMEIQEAQAAATAAAAAAREEPTLETATTTLRSEEPRPLRNEETRALNGNGSGKRTRTDGPVDETQVYAPSNGTGAPLPTGSTLPRKRRKSAS